MTAYFDNSATTRPCKEATEVAIKAITENWGNPSSLHSMGSDASAALKKSRKKVAKLLGVNEDNFFFTASGTTANNTAIFGAYNKLKKQGNRIVTTAIEHPSVGEPINALEKAGVEVIRLAPDKYGKINDFGTKTVTSDSTLRIEAKGGRLPTDEGHNLSPGLL